MGRIMDLSRFEKLVKERTGLSFGAGRSAKLVEAIQTAMSTRGMLSPAELYSCLLHNGPDFVEFVNLLTVNETYFFREPVHFKLLVESLIPELRKQGGAGRKIKILSAGCSTGEEPYSVAISLLEEMGESARHQFRIIGVDIDSDAVLKGRNGIYGRPSFRNLDPALRARYFDRIGENQYRLRDTVKDAVDLRVFNLLSTPYPRDLSELDVILYRNVSIYFEPDVQEKIFHNLSRALRHRGYFITSATEAVSHRLNVLNLMEMEDVFFYQKPSSRAETVVSPRRGRAGTGTVSPPAAPLEMSTEDLWSKALSLAEVGKYEGALGWVQELIDREPSLARAYALQSKILIHLDRMDEAQRAGLKSIEEDTLCLEGYLLLGWIAGKREDHDRSILRWKEALYVKPGCWPAHYFLAEIYYRRGEYEKARQEYAIIRDLSERGGLRSTELMFFPVDLSVERVMRKCRRKLSEIELPR